jgi:hypothetical protein
MQTGENEHGLRKIIDLTRLISIVLLLLHFYYRCFGAFKKWEFTSTITNRLLINVEHTGMFEPFIRIKLISIGFLLISLLGARGKKMEQLNYKTGLVYILIGSLLYFGSFFILDLHWYFITAATVYMLACSFGYILILTGGVLLSRVIQVKFSNKDIFNRENETFPQEERLLQNEYSINLPATYRLKNALQKSWINIINPFRGLLVLGSPGAGKSYFIIRHIIAQHMRKGFSLFVYDFKYDDLTKIVYNQWLKNKNRYPVKPSFFVINFDDLSCSNRCNPLDHLTMKDITDAAESARTILLGLNREWIRRQGDFFVESPINFLTAIIWFLRKYREGEFCTLPHVIELMQTGYDNLFTVLRAEKEIEVLINPFVTAYLNNAMEQLEGQIASAKIAMARLSSPQLYYVLSGNDFTLDINNPASPKIVCMGNNPQKIQTYGAVLSLYISRLIKIVNQKGKQKCSLIFDEFPTIFLNNIDSLIATARSNKVATTLAVQDFSQLRKDYGKEQADVIMNISGNIISGQVTGDTAKQLSERFGKIMQERNSYSVNQSDTSFSHSSQLENAIPPSKISGLSSGEFVGMVADDQDRKIELKTFHCNIQNDHTAIKAEEATYHPIPQCRKLDNSIIQRNYLQIKQEVEELVESELERIISNPALQHLVIRK